MPMATEAEETEALFQWAAYQMGRWPELELMYHIPNEGKRHPLHGAALKRQGLKPGVPDLCLPVPSQKYCGLYIEMKRRNGKVTDAQRDFIDKLCQRGYMAIPCWGWEQARDAIEIYMRGVIR